FAALVVIAQKAQSDTAARTSVLDQYAEAKGAHEKASEDLAALRKEHREASAHRDNLPPALRAAREALAEAAGMNVEALPFVCELIDVRPEFEPWREAFNLALGGFAARLLLDKGQLAQFRGAINEVRTARRVQFLGVPTGQEFSVELDGKTLPGRLSYRPSPFQEWLQYHLQGHFNFLCVDEPKLLAQYDKAMTITGQTAERGQGAHGGQGGSNILGFSNTLRLAELSDRIRAAQEAGERAAAQLSQAKDAFDSFDARATAYANFLHFSWRTVDVESALHNKRQWDELIAEIRAENPQIAKLQEQVTERQKTAQKLHEDNGACRNEATMLEARWQTKVTEVDRAQLAQDAAEQAGAVATAEQAEYLTNLFAQCPRLEATDSLTQFDQVVTWAAGQLTSRHSAAKEKLANARESLQRIFSHFLQRWPNPNLGRDPLESYGDFDRLLSELTGNGLHKIELEWRNSLLSLSGADLTALASGLVKEVESIQERIDPVNRILADLSFSDDKHRLYIGTQKIESRPRAQFHRKMREVRAAISDATTEEERERTYKLMEQVIKYIRRSEPTFTDIVDVRNHVRISAEKRDLDGQHVAIYDHIGEKSGGESQELVAFIVGAALRYQLGDAGASRPRYAPIFLDEALIKADAHFTGRAIGAWRGLGFQLIIGAPNDKFSAIEPHVSAQYVIQKSAEGRSWAKLFIGMDPQ
ncbi:MAG: ATP-binding protein, partial [Angustibacter sp.]